MKKINVQRGYSKNKFWFCPDKEMIEIELGKSFAEDDEYDRYWSVEMSGDEWSDLGVEAGMLTEDYQPNLNIEDGEYDSCDVGPVIDELAYKELKKRFIIEFRKDWKRVISTMGGVELIFPEGYGREIITM